MVDSMDELKSSRSVAGKDFPNFEMLDARSASALNKIFPNSHFIRRAVSRNRKPRQRTGFFDKERSPS